MKVKRAKAKHLAGHQPEPPPARKPLAIVPNAPRRARIGPYEATSTRPRVADWDRTQYGPNAAFDDGDIARARAQDAVRNNPWLRRALKILVAHEIGCGLQPRPKIADPGLRKELLELWNDWTAEADADGTSDFYGWQGILSRARRESGEAFIRLRNRLPEDGLSVPLQVQALEAAMVPMRHNAANGKNAIRQGIEITPFGTRAAYWFYGQHPGELNPYLGRASLSANDLIRVPAQFVLHHYTPERPGQLRGVPTPISALVRARNFDAYESAELVRKKSRAKFIGAIYRETDDENPVTDDAARIEADQAARENQRAFVDLEDGYLLNLAQGELLNLYDGDKGAVGIDFLRVQLRAIAAGMGVPYELMTNDYGDTNDRVMKVILNAYYRGLEMEQDRLVSQVLQPVWSTWLDAVALNRILRMPRDYFDNPRAWRRCEWRSHAWSYPNPLQEAQTKKILVDEGFTSRAAVVAEMGWDVEDIDQQNYEDQERERGLGLVYGKDPTPFQQQDSAQP